MRYLVIKQIAYKEQMYTILSNLAENHGWHYYNGLNTTSVTELIFTISIFSILLLVLPSNFTVSGGKSSR